MKEKEKSTILVKNIKTGEFEEWTIRPLKKIAKRKYDIEQCKAWHEKGKMREECKTCGCMECEYTKKEAE